MSEAKILIIDLGSQTTEVIATALREEGYRSAILDQDKAGVWLRNHPAEAIILSGGDHSVNAPDAPQPPIEIWSARPGGYVPILGICYGHQWLAKHYGGKVANEPGLREYGKSEISIEAGGILFRELADRQTVWTSHGDTVVSLPQGFELLATSSTTGGIAAMVEKNRKIYGVQFHPEDPETVQGKRMLVNFVEEICGCKKDWKPSDMVASISRDIEGQVRGQKILVPYSGGVDSSVAAALAVRSGCKVEGITLDVDNLREGEVEEIRSHARCIGLVLGVLNLHRYIELLANTTDAQEKRRIFQVGIYVPSIKDAAKRIGATYILQGTLAPDMIESGERGGALIKTHHNTGVDFGLEQLHPLAHLFKHEVRELARLLDLPESISERKPFPGPGNILRIVGVPVTHERLAAVRWAYAQVERIIRELDPKLWANISQLVVAYLGGSQLTGVRGDARAYEGIAAVRAVETVNYMSARGIYLPEAVARPIMSTLITRPPFIRVMFDPSDKAPATIEYE